VTEPPCPGSRLAAAAARRVHAWWARRKFVGAGTWPPPPSSARRCRRPEHSRPASRARPGQASHPVAAQEARLGVGTDYEDWQVLGWLSADPGLCATITGSHVRVLVVLMARSTPDTRAAIATVSGVTTRNGAPARPVARWPADVDRHLALHGCWSVACRGRSHLHGRRDWVSSSSVPACSSRHAMPAATVLLPDPYNPVIRTPSAPRRLPAAQPAAPQHLWTIWSGVVPFPTSTPRSARGEPRRQPDLLLAAERNPSNRLMVIRVPPQRRLRPKASTVWAPDRAAAGGGVPAQCRVAAAGSCSRRRR
jgi:hypothetical protein